MKKPQAHEILYGSPLGRRDIRKKSNNLVTVLLQNLNNNSNKTLWEVYALKPHAQTQSNFSV